jgi:outer membrane lipoprotein-sorting protein
MRLAVLIALLFVGSSFAQQDKSKSILEELGKKVKAYKSFYIEFKSVIKNTDAGINETVEGKGWVKGDKFLANYGTNTVISNGVKNWIISAADKTVYISSVDNNSDDAINPKNLMTIWEKDVKSKYIKEEKGMHIIHLYPLVPSKKDFHTILLKIGVTSKDLHHVEVRMKDGTRMFYDITKLTPNVDVADSKFVYNKKDYPGYEEIED